MGEYLPWLSPFENLSLGNSPVPSGALPFLSQLAGGLGGGSKATSTSNVASNVNVALQNVIGSGSTAPQTGGSATAQPSFTDATTPYNPPSYLGGATGISPSAYSPKAGEAETGFFSDPIMIAVIAAAGLGAWLFLGK